MPFVPQAIYDELLSTLRDVTAGRLVRVGDTPATVAPPPPEVAVERLLALVPDVPSPPVAPAMPRRIVEACQTFATSARGVNANYTHARTLMAQGANEEQVVYAIRNGAS